VLTRRRRSLLVIGAVTVLAGGAVTTSAVLHRHPAAAARARQLCARVQPVNHGRLAAAFPASADVLARWDVEAGREYQPFLGILPRGASPWTGAPGHQFVAVCFTQAVVTGPLTGISRVDVPAHGAPIHRGDVYRIRRPPAS
jgi:hypothetical protein